MIDIDILVRQSIGLGDNKHAEGALDSLRALLSALLTFGMNDEIDRICRRHFLVTTSPMIVGRASR